MLYLSLSDFLLYRRIHNTRLLGSARRNSVQVTGKIWGFYTGLFAHICHLTFHDSLNRMIPICTFVLFSPFLSGAMVTVAVTVHVGFFVSLGQCSSSTDRFCITCSTRLLARVSVVHGYGNRIITAGADCSIVGGWSIGRH